MKYSIGMKIKINDMKGESKDYIGKEGVITHIDDIGQLHGTWGSLALIPHVDDFTVLEERDA